MADLPSVYVHIVTFNSAPATIRCIESVFEQQQVTITGISISDNASTNSIAKLLNSTFGERIALECNQHNLGFCAAQNRGARRFIDSAAQYFLVLNPDVRLEANTLAELVAAQQRHPRAGLVTPMLLRADAELNPVSPPILDACGMMLTSSLRHLDRGSGNPNRAQYEDEEIVFGGTGACLLISRACVEAIALSPTPHEDLKAIVEPALILDQSKRLQLFDEAFFAYREDADLCWRAANLGWRCVYAPRARAFHTRAVLPERRGQLSAAINLMGVRNRFLLQLNNLSPFNSLTKFVVGVLFRNIVVILAVLLFERSSLSGLRQVLKLMPRALERRRIVARMRRGA